MKTLADLISNAVEEYDRQERERAYQKHLEQHNRDQALITDLKATIDQTLGAEVLQVLPLEYVVHRTGNGNSARAEFSYHGTSYGLFWDEECGLLLATGERRQYSFLSVGSAQSLLVSLHQFSQGESAY